MKKQKKNENKNKMISYKKALKVLNISKIKFKSEKIESSESVGRACSENIYSSCVQGAPKKNSRHFLGHFH